MCPDHVGHLKPSRPYHLHRLLYVLHNSRHSRSISRGLLSDTYHRFTAKQRYWGFTRFSELRKLFQPQPGHNRPTIEEESAVISAYVRVLEDPTGVLWRNFVE